MISDDAVDDTVHVVCDMKGPHRAEYRRQSSIYHVNHEKEKDSTQRYSDSAYDLNPYRTYSTVKYNMVA